MSEEVARFLLLFCHMYQKINRVKGQNILNEYLLLLKYINVKYQ